MKDLIVKYTATNGETNERKYNTIMDFIDAFEKSEKPETTFTNINSMFFENPLNTKQFSTAQELYDHCVAIVS